MKNGSKMTSSITNVWQGRQILNSFSKFDEHFLHCLASTTDLFMLKKKKKQTKNLLDLFSAIEIFAYNKENT